MHLLIAGFFGEGNLGDEAILQGILSSVAPPTRVTVTTGTQAGPLTRTFNRLPRRGWAGWAAFLPALRTLRRDGGRVMLSGGLLQDWTFEGVSFFALRMLAAHHFGGGAPTLWGAGLGPLRRPGARALARRALRHAEAPWLRDEASCRLFTELTGRRAHLGADWSWGLDPAKVAGDSMERGDLDLATLPGSVSNWSQRNTPVQSIHDLAPVCEGTGAINLRPWLIPGFADRAHQIHQTWSSDIKNWVGVAARAEDARALSRLFPDLQVRLPTDFAALLRWSSGLQLGLAMRYHVVLAFLRAGIPTLALPYDPKVTALLHEATGSSPKDTTMAKPRPIRPELGFNKALRQRFTRMQAAFHAYLERPRR